MNYIPGKGGAIVPVVGVGIGAAAAQLPQTGSHLVNEIALIAVATLVVWAVAYKLTHKKAV